jgi:superfamily II RNA helicase
MIMQNDFYPAIIFSFGKRECENNALQMGKVTLNNGKFVIYIWENYTDRL